MNAVQFLSRINEEVISRSTLLPKTPVTIKTNIKRGNLVLDKRSLTAYFNGLVLPHLDYTDIVSGDKKGLTTRMKQLQSYQNRFAIKIVKAKVKTDEALTLARWTTLHARRFGRLCCFVQDVLKGVIPEHLDVFSSTMSQQHGYSTRNGYMPKVSRPRTE